MKAWKYVSNASFFLSVTTMTFIMKFIHIIDTSSTKSTVFFHKVYFIINITFHLCVNRYTSMSVA